MVDQDSIKGNTADTCIQFVAQIKQYMVYGVSLAYPVISLVTFLGVIKLAFDIPPEIAAVVAFIGVLTIGVISFRSGLYAHDMNISWKNTPMAVDIHKGTDTIEKKVDILTKELEDQSELIRSLLRKV
jgi:hypothetical protein